MTSRERSAAPVVTDPPSPELPDPRIQFFTRLIPTLGQPLAQYRRDLWEREARRVEAMATAAGERISVEALFEAIRSDERVEGMFRAAVESAQRATSDAKVRLLGRALASGVLANDDALVDEAEVLLRVAAQLEGPEIRALVVLDRLSADYGHRLSDCFSPLIERGFIRAIVDPIVGRLVHLGLLVTESEGRLDDPADRSNEFVDVDQTWVVTPAALKLIKLLEAESVWRAHRMSASREPSLPSGTPPRHGTSRASTVCARLTPGD